MTTPETIANANAISPNAARTGHGSVERTVTRGTPADMFRVHQPNLSPPTQPLFGKRERGRKLLHLHPHHCLQAAAERKTLGLAPTPPQQAGEESRKPVMAA